MSKDKGTKDQEKQPAIEPGQGQARARLSRKEYEAKLAKLHAELVAMQEWIKVSGGKVCVVFEGRDAAGKGGTIKAITERVRSPRVFRSTDDKKRSRLNIIAHFLSQVPYEPLAPRDIALPKRQKSDSHPDPHLALRYIPTPF